MKIILLIILMCGSVAIFGTLPILKNDPRTRCIVVVSYLVFVVNTIWMLYFLKD